MNKAIVETYVWLNKYPSFLLTQQMFMSLSTRLIQLLFPSSWKLEQCTSNRSKRAKVFDKMKLTWWTSKFKMIHWKWVVINVLKVFNALWTLKPLRFATVNLIIEVCIYMWSKTFCFYALAFNMTTYIHPINLNLNIKL